MTVVICITHYISLLEHTSHSRQIILTLMNFELLNLCTRASTTDMKEKLLHSLCAGDSKLRIVVGTTAFGMGIDCHDI